MRGITSAEQYYKSRDDWFKSISRQIVEDRPSPIEGASTITRALLRLTFGGGHLLGFKDEELTLPELNQTLVTTEIARWRLGYVPPRFARYWSVAWISLFCYGRDSSTVPNKLLSQLLKHPVGLQMQEGTSRDLSLSARSADALRWALENGHQLPFEATYNEPVTILDVGENHLALASLLISSDLGKAVEVLLPLEALAGTFDDAADRRFDAWLLDARRIHETYLSTPGSWPGSSVVGVPPHYADWILNRGGRQGHSTTGVVPGWFATAESVGELEELGRLAYGIGISMEQTPELLCIHVFALAEDRLAPSDRSLQYFYHRTEMNLRRLRITAAMRMVLFDLMYLDSSNNLLHHATFQIPLDDWFVDQIIDFIGTADPDDSFESYLPNSAEEEAEVRAQSAELRRFEVARVVRLDVNGSSSAAMVNAVSDYLSALDRASAVARLGGRGSASLAELSERRTLLRNLINDMRALSIDVGKDALLCLGDHRAFLHLELNEDGFLTPVASWLGSDGTAQYRHFDCGRLTGPASGSDLDMVQHLRSLLEPVAALVQEGIEHIVISPPANPYHLPYHEALLEHFVSASYAPSLALLQPPLLHQMGCGSSAVVGWPGGDGSPLQGVEPEIEVVAGLYDSVPAQAVPLKGAFRVLHLAGHGYAGSSEAQSVIRLGPAGDLSGTAVLRDYRLAGTELAVLSACSTGDMTYGDRQLLEAAPLDVCLQAVGVKAIVYTSRPVDDRVAFIFATVLHAALIEGHNLWTAYEGARVAARKPSRKTVPSWLLPRVDAAWPGWETRVLPPGAADDWLAFRLGGRHWA